MTFLTFIFKFVFVFFNSFSHKSIYMFYKSSVTNIGLFDTNNLVICAPLQILQWMQIIHRGQRGHLKLCVFINIWHNGDLIKEHLLYQIMTVSRTHNMQNSKKQAGTNFSSLLPPSPSVKARESQSWPCIVQHSLQPSSSLQSPCRSNYQNKKQSHFVKNVLIYSKKVIREVMAEIFF